MPVGGDASILALAILRTCLPDWIDADGAVRRPATPRARATVHATAASLGRPYATAHRLVGRLRERGAAVAVDGGVAIGCDDRWGPAVEQYLWEAHDLFLRFAEELDAAGQLDRSRRVPSRDPSRLAVIRTALDVLLAPFELFRGQIGDWTSKKLWQAVSTLSVRHVTVDPVLSARYAHASTPDTERRAVSGAALSRLVGTSAATTWRHCSAMAAAGVLTRVDGSTRAESGWMLRTHELLEASMEAAVQGIVAFDVRRVEELTALGLDPARPRWRYGRPALVPFDPPRPISANRPVSGP